MNELVHRSAVNSVEEPTAHLNGVAETIRQNPAMTEWR